MQVQNFECQIAKAQIGRYVAGDILSEETMEQLEAHVAKCPDCKQNLAERRAVLQAMLTTDEPKPANQQESPQKNFDLADFIKSKIQSKQPVQAAVQVESVKTASFTKPALYSLALGAVLIAMSYVSKNMGSVLGPKAVDAPAVMKKPAAAIPTNRIAKPEPKPNPAKSVGPVKSPPLKSASETIAANSTPAITKKHKLVLTKKSPKPKAKKEARSKHSHSRSRKTPRPATNSVHIYNPENRP